MATKPTATAAPSLNMYQKIAVIRHSSDSLTYDDSDGNSKSVSVQQLGDAIATAVRSKTPSVALILRIVR
jgi:hypothetical protein